MSSIYVSDTPAAINSSTFDYDKSLITLYVPKGCIEVYRAAENWSDFPYIEEYVPEDPSQYDLNHDGRVSIEDVTTLVNYILTHPELENP